MTKTASGNVRTNIYLTPTQHTALNRLSDHTGLSVAEHARRALDFYLAFSDDITKTVDRIAALPAKGKKEKN